MTQYLPPDDTFSASISSSPSAWQRIQPWTVMPNYSSGGCEFGGMSPVSRATLSSGYFLAPTGSSWPAVYVGSTPRLATATEITDESVPGSPPTTFPGTASCWAFRNASVADTDVSAFFLTETQGFPPATGAHRNFGLGARVQGGSLVNAGDLDLERQQLQDGYWAVRAAQTNFPTIGMKWILFRSNAGVVTRLAESPTGESVTLPYADAARPFVLRMTVENDGSGDVEIHVYRTWADDLVLAPGTSTEVLTYTDSSASKITAAGQVGLMLSTEYGFVGPPKIVMGPACSWIEATNIATGSLLFREEWQRDAPSGYCREVAGQGSVSPTQPLRPGYALACGWYGDLFTDSEAFSIAGVREYNGSLLLNGGYAEWTPPTGTAPTPRTLRSSRPATSSFNQDRSAVVRFPSAGTADTTDPRMAGISLRLAADYPEPDYATGARAGYVFWLRYSDYSGFWAAGVTRIYPMISIPFRQYELLAFKEGLTGLALDADITLSMSIENVNGPNQVSNAPKIICEINGVQVPFLPANVWTAGGTSDEAGFAPTPITSGITVNSTGYIWDESSRRIPSGTGEGLFVYAPNTAGASSQKVLFGSWTEGAGSGPGGGDGLPEQDQASVSVAFDESPGTVSPATKLTVPLHWTVTESRSQLANVHELDSGHVYRGAVSPYQRRTWKVSSSGATAAETAALLAFWDARDGSEGAFWWDTPRGETVLVHFRDDELETVLVAPEVSEFDFQLEEVR